MVNQYHQYLNYFIGCLIDTRLLGIIQGVEAQCSVYTTVSSIHPTLMQGCFHNSMDNLLNFMPSHSF